MKRLSLLFMFALVFAGLAFGQLGTATAAYSAGDIPTDKDFTYYSGTQSSDCPGQLSVTIPTGATILSVDVSYDMTSDNSPGSYIARQRSHFRCVSPGGLPEPAITNAPYIYDPGTQSYNRTGLDIANGVAGGGDIQFELHAGATFYKDYCSVDSVKVDNNTWTVNITYIPAGYPTQALNPVPVDGELYVGLDDDLSWEFGENTETYDVYFGTDNPPATKLVENEIAGATGTFDPGTMDVNQTYYWQIVSHNADGFTEGPVWSFTTVCGAFATPFSEDFEEVTPPELPYCWQRIFNTTSSWAKLETVGYGGYTGPQCIQLSNSDDIDATLIFIAPMIDLEGGTLADKMVHFFAKGESYPNFSVGTMSDPTDESTFTPYETFFLWNDYREYDIYLDEYTGTDEYIAFRLEPSTTYQAGYIDDITIDDLPTCIKPGDLDAGDLTINSAMLYWTDINGASSWNIEYGPKGFSPTGTPTVSGVSNPYELTSLNSATEYDFYVQTDCGGGDLSSWAGPSSFMTPCDYSTLPFSENFDASLDLPACWTGIVQTADGWTINGIQNYESHSVPNSYHMSNGWDENSTLILALPPFETLSDKSIKFYAKNNLGSYDLEVGTMSDPNNPASFVALTSVTTTNTYQEYEVWLHTYTGTNEYIALKHGNGSAFLNMFIDDVSVELLPSCLPPVNLYFDNITTTTAMFHWTETGSATDWVVEIGAPGFEPGTGNEISTYNHSDAGLEQSIELTGLTAGTAYDVYVISDCGDGDWSDWSGPAKFLTTFPNLTPPVMEDFEAGLGITGNSPENGQDWEINTDLFVSGAQSVYNAYGINNDNVLYILGNFDFTAKADLMLSFWHIAYADVNNDHCYVEISTDGGASFDQLPESTYAGAGYYREEGLYNNPEGPCFDRGSYELWGTPGVSPDNTWWKKEYFDLSAYNAFSEVQLRFRLVSDNWDSDGAWYIDDIAIEALGTPDLTIAPTAFDQEVSMGDPIANTDLTVANAGNFPSAFTATVVYDETDLINEDFNVGIPGDWTVVSRGTSEVTWAGTNGIYGQSFDGTPFVWADGLQNYAPVALTMDDDLISPAVDASVYADGTLQLEFDMVFDADFQTGDTARIYVFDGTEWIMIYEAWTDDGSIYSGGVHKVYDVAAYANENFQVKYNYYEGPVNRGRYFAIDNVRLRASMAALDWVTLDGGASTSGVSMPDEAIVVDVAMDATGLELGDYTANIEVVTNEPGKANTIIPVTMTVVPIAPPTDLMAMADMSTINLTYNLNEAGNDVIIAFNTIDAFDQPVNGMEYQVGEVIGTNGTVIYQGPMTEFSHTDLLPNTTYYYKAWSVALSSVYSAEGATASATTGDYQLICLSEGWSGVSSYKVPESPALEEMLAEIENELVILLSTTGYYWPSQNINGIGDWNTHSGYKIKVSEDTYFTVTGEMPEDKTITVTAGTNFIPVLCDHAVPATEIFSQFGNDLVFAFDIYSGLIYWPAGGIYTLETLEPGIGYLVSMAQPAEATFECDDPTKAGYVKANKQTYENAPWTFAETGSQHLISINKSALADLEKGDFVGVFNSYGECAGFTQYNGENGNILLVAYSDDFTTADNDGLQEGENMTFRIFSPSLQTDTETAVTFDSMMPNSNSFADMGQSMILKFGEGATSISENAITEINMYPNPATDLVNISINGDYTNATVVIYDTEGRMVINQVFIGQTEINISSLEAGIYFVKINTSTTNEIKKLVIK